MNKRIGLWSAVGLFTLSLSSLADAADVKNGYAVEEVKVSERLTFGSDPTVMFTRTVVNIPQDYGKIISTQVEATGTTFWLESGDGKLRNIVVAETTRPVLIRRSGKLE